MKHVYYKVEGRKVKLVEVKNEQEELAVKIANREFHRFEKQEKRAKAHYLSLDSLMADGFEPADKGTDIESEYIKKEEEANLKKLLADVMKNLTPRQKEMIQYVFYEGKSQSEVANIYGIDKSAVTKAMKRIYDTLRKRIEEIKNNDD